MSKFKQVKDIFKTIEEFYHNLSIFYKELSDNSDKLRVKMVLDYLSAYSSELEKHFVEERHELKENILNTWVQFTSEDESLKCPKAELEKKPKSVDEVIDIATKFNSCLCKLFKQLASETEYDEVKNVFENLYDYTERHEKKLVVNAERVKML